MKTIKKHPIAFISLIGWSIISLSFFIAVLGIDADWVLFLSGLLFVLGSAVFAVSFVVGIIAAIAKRKKKSQNSEHINLLARQYVVNSKFTAFYVILLFVFSPITPLLLINLLDYYAMGFMAFFLGIMVWLAVFSKDIFLNHFYKIKNTDKYFTIENGDNKQLADSFYGDYIHVYLSRNWDSASNYICNLLYHEKCLGKNIKCYKVTNEFLRSNFGYNYNSYFDELILVPFSQFDLEHGKTLKDYFDCLSIARFTDLVNQKYHEKDSTYPHDYANNDKSLSLIPERTQIRKIQIADNCIRIAVTSACDMSNIHMTYLNCLMVATNAKLLEGNAKEAYSNIYIDTLSINTEAKTIDIAVIDTEADDGRYYESDEEFFNSMRSTFKFSYENIEWHWDGFCDMTKTRMILYKIEGEDNTNENTDNSF